MGTETQQKVLLIQKKIDKLYKQLNDLKEECPHTNFSGEYKSDTGNWCPSDDCYWIDVKCEDCGKRWSADSKRHRDEYYRLSGSGRISKR